MTDLMSLDGAEELQAWVDDPLSNLELQDEEIQLLINTAFAYHSQNDRLARFKAALRFYADGWRDEPLFGLPGAVSKTLVATQELHRDKGERARRVLTGVAQAYSEETTP